MSEEKITYDDVKQYEKLFTLTPSFLLERWAKKNTNLVSKFESRVESFLNHMDDNKRKKLLFRCKLYKLRRSIYTIWKRNKRITRRLASKIYRQYYKNTNERTFKIIKFIKFSSNSGIRNIQTSRV